MNFQQLRDATIDTFAQPDFMTLPRAVQHGEPGTLTGVWQETHRIDNNAGTPETLIMRQATTTMWIDHATQKCRRVVTRSKMIEDNTGAYGNPARMLACADIFSPPTGTNFNVFDTNFGSVSNFNNGMASQQISFAPPRGSVDASGNTSGFGFDNFRASFNASDGNTLLPSATQQGNAHEFVQGASQGSDWQAFDDSAFMNFFDQSSQLDQSLNWNGEQNFAADTMIGQGASQTADLNMFEPLGGPFGLNQRAATPSGNSSMSSMYTDRSYQPQTGGGTPPNDATPGPHAEELAGDVQQLLNEPLNAQWHGIDMSIPTLESVSAPQPDREDGGNNFVEDWLNALGDSPVSADHVPEIGLPEMNFDFDFRFPPTTPSAPIMGDHSVLPPHIAWTPVDFHDQNVFDNTVSHDHDSPLFTPAPSVLGTEY